MRYLIDQYHSQNSAEFLCDLHKRLFYPGMANIILWWDLWVFGLTVSSGSVGAAELDPVSVCWELPCYILTSADWEGGLVTWSAMVLVIQCVQKSQIYLSCTGCPRTQLCKIMFLCFIFDRVKIRIKVAMKHKALPIGIFHVMLMWVGLYFTLYIWEFCK